MQFKTHEKKQRKNNASEIYENWMEKKRKKSYEEKKQEFLRKIFWILSFHLL